MKQNIKFLFSLALLLVCSCSADNSEKFQYTELEIWFHSGSETERRTIQQQVSRYNNLQHKYRVNAVILPVETYGVHIARAASAGSLPDIVEFDSAYIYRYIWQDNIIPIDKLLSETSRTDLLPSIIEQSMYQGRLYSVSLTESTLVMYANRNQLDNMNIRIPKTNRKAWTIPEFEQILKKLSQNDPDGAVLDLQLNRKGEWVTYAFSPILQSAGGDLIERRSYLTSQGILNSEESVNAMERLQSWIKSGLVDPNVDNQAFVTGRVALSWADQNNYHQYLDALDKDLILLPLPDFGQGSRTGQNTWNLGITSQCKNIRAAVHFLEFLLNEDEVLVMSEASGKMPATFSAVDKSPDYQPGGKLELFAKQLESSAIPRPKTPAYPVISSTFQRAFSAIMQGEDAYTSLTRAATIIDQDIRAHNGYSQQARK